MEGEEKFSSEIVLNKRSSIRKKTTTLRRFDERVGLHEAKLWLKIEECDGNREE
jgi:hypothetical protein